jgi:predicted enzyme related to lactoylglutathione lyase
VERSLPNLSAADFKITITTVNVEQGVRVYFDTDSIDDTLAKAIVAGGKVLYPKTSIGELGWVAELEDSEGNCIALSQPLSD